MVQTEAERQLAKLVSMPTLSDDIVANDAALDYIQDYLAKRGMFCIRDRFNRHGTLLASTRPDNAWTPKVLLSAHVDVMAGSEKLFKLRHKGDKLLGRGVFDMKFSIAGYMQWVDDVQDKLPDYDVAIAITTDEEYGGRDDINGTHRLVEAGLRPKICIMPDSTAPGWDLESLSKGAWRFDLVAKGRTAHGSRPWDGDSASFKLIPALQKLQDLFKDHNTQTDSLNIAVITGGVTYNQVPAEMSAAIEIRFLDQKGFDKLFEFIQSLCEHHGLLYKERAVYAPVVTDFNNPLVKPYLESLHTVTGKKPPGFISCATTDAPFFAEVGIPCIISCCAGGRHHSEDEWISRKSFLQFVPILHDYLDKVAKTPHAAMAIDAKAALV